MNAHQKVTSAEEYFNNQVDKMAHSMDTSQLRSLSSPNGLMNKVAMMARMEVIHGPNNVDLY